MGSVLSTACTISSIPSPLDVDHLGRWRGASACGDGGRDRGGGDASAGWMCIDRPGEATATWEEGRGCFVCVKGFGSAMRFSESVCAWPRWCRSTCGCDARVGWRGYR